VIGVKGIYKTRQKEIAARFVQFEYEDKYDKMKKDETIDFIDTYSAAFKKDIFLSMGGYDTSFPVACAEDVDLSYRLSSEGHKMVFNPKAIVYHIHPNTLIGYLKKKYKFAFWRVLAVKRNPQKMVKDSHTPQSTKFELMLIPLIYISLIASMFYNSSLTAIIFVIYLLIISISVSKILQKDIVIGLLSPILIFLRDNIQFAGLLGGIINIAKDRFVLRSS
jgi:GT2 family glycosyltransferase